MAAAIHERHPYGPLHLVGVLNGSFVFLADLLRALEFRDQVTVRFLRAQSYEGTESTRMPKIELLFERLPLHGTTILVEDIVDTGYTIQAIGRRLGRFEVATLLDKPLRRKVPVRLDYVGKHIEDLFVVGYGMDYWGMGRELRSIYYVR